MRAVQQELSVLSLQQTTLHVHSENLQPGEHLPPNAVHKGIYRLKL